MSKNLEDEISYLKSVHGQYKITPWILDPKKSKPMQIYIKHEGNKLKESKTPIKTKSAKKVLQLMDNDWDYSKALKKVMKDDKISKEQLEKELDPWI